MIVYKIANLWNFDSFPNFKTLNICYCSKLNDFRNLMILKIIKFGKFSEFSGYEIFGILQIEDFWNFANCKFFEFPKLKFF